VTARGARLAAVFVASAAVGTAAACQRASAPPAAGEAGAAEGGWFAFQPGADTFSSGSPIDLRYLNERFAGEHGFIGVKDGHFILRGTGQPIRFWGVNADPRRLEPSDLRRTARFLARYGVNLARLHGGYFDERGDVDLARVRQAIEIVEAMKAEGIYTLFSIYFPLWLEPRPDAHWLQGYDGRHHPFAALFFDPAFQARYRSWWTALLTTPSATTGRRLVDDPAVAALEMVNEDSLLFWTFDTESMPDLQARLVEKALGDWAAKRYGSIGAALEAWKGTRAKRDAPAEGRLGIRPLWTVLREKALRDQDTVRFLFETQARFYTETRAFLRGLGFRGPITASNWVTASPELLGPLEKLSYTQGDFIDRHGYFSCGLKGPESAWSIRAGYTYADRSALRFEAEEQDAPRKFEHPAMDPHYGGAPSMISETTWDRPNRFRSEAPLYYAAYGALQGSDAIVHFALDGTQWSVKPRSFMQPWTLTSPAMMGQFPVAALVFRLGLVTAGPVVAEVGLRADDLFQLHGTPLPQDAALDELRLPDVPHGTVLPAGQRLDPLVHYAGRVAVRFGAEGQVNLTRDLGALIDHARQHVASATGELKLDYGKGILTIDALRVQGASGNLKTAGTIVTRNLTISSDLDLLHVVVVSLDGRPLASSRQMLLQVMSEERATGFRTEELTGGRKRIVRLGTDPWQVRDIAGTVALRRADASSLRVIALDQRGYPAGTAGNADRIALWPRTIYYLIEN
jgi:hypothetical protein